MKDLEVHSVWFTAGIQLKARTVQSASTEDTAQSKGCRIGLTDYGVWIQDGDTEIIVPYFQIKQVFLK